MTPPAIRSLRFLLLILLISPAAAATFPLQIPTRPTTFPLQRPTLAGEVVAWGSNTFGQISVPPNLTNVVAIAAGMNHSLALRNDGKVFAWGDNQFGQCSVPGGLTDVVSVAAGTAHSLALRSDGRVVAWGPQDSRTTVPSFLADAVSIAGSGYGSYVIRRDGSGVAWGDANWVRPASWAATNIVGLGSGWGSVFALSSEGKVQDWGSDFPIMNRGTDITVLTGGFSSPGAIRADGSVIARIDNSPLGLKAVALASASYHFAAIKADSAVVVWKAIDAWDGVPGPANPVLTTVPPRLRGAFAIAGGDAHFLALKLPTPPIPTTAKASAEIVNGFIVDLNIHDGGEGYAEPPKVTITGGGGSGATATAQISRGIVTGFTMISAGSGYTTQPTITIDSPPFLPKLAIAPSRVNVTMQVVPGKRYQLESSDDLPNFSAVGAPFNATANTLTNEFTLTETGQFFRIQEVP